MSRYLIDNSVLQRLPRSAAVQAAVSSLLDADHELCCCALSLDEFAYSARSVADHAEASHRYGPHSCTCRSPPPSTNSSSTSAPRSGPPGTGRAAGVIDVALAATAVHHDATILHYDSDFDHIPPPTRPYAPPGWSPAAPSTDRCTEQPRAYPSDSVRDRGVMTTAYLRQGSPTKFARDACSRAPDLPATLSGPNPL